jgi:hypothetical protein
MTYKVEFEVDGDAVTYTVRAENVLNAEEAAKKQLEKDNNVKLQCGRGYHDRGKAYSKDASIKKSRFAWAVTQIENIKEA